MRHCNYVVRASGLKPQVSSLRTCPRGAAWSARLPVTQEIAGSNPVEGAFDKHGAVRKPAKRPSSNLGDLRVRLPPAPLENMRRLEPDGKAAALQAVRLADAQPTHGFSGAGGSRTRRSPRFELGRFADLRTAPCSSKAPSTGFEPVISCVTGRRALQAAPRGPNHFQ